MLLLVKELGDDLAVGSLFSSFDTLKAAIKSKFNVDAEILPIVKGTRIENMWVSDNGATIGTSWGPMTEDIENGWMFSIPGDTIAGVVWFTVEGCKVDEWEE